MSATTHLSDRITLDEQAVSQAKNARSSGLSLVLRDQQGTVHEIPEELRRILHKALESIDRNEGVRIGRVPEELTSTTAADILGVSRPTLLRWAADGLISSHKVGSHARFTRADVFQLKSQRDAERRASFAALRAFDKELEENE